MDFPTVNKHFIAIASGVHGQQVGSDISLAYLLAMDSRSDAA
jgi:hypothetical protein